MRLRKSKKINKGLNGKLARSKWVVFGLVVGVVLATIGSIAALNGWFGGGNSVPKDTMTRGLVGYWSMDEGSGITVNDSSGYGNNATTSGASWTAGKVGGGLEFDGVDDYISAADSVSLDITNALTMEMWVYDPPPEKSQTMNNKLQTNLEELKIKEAGDNKYAFKTLDDNVIEIGTEKHSPPQPYLNLTKWDGEVSLKVGIPFETGEKPMVMGDKIRYSTTDSQPLTFWQKVLSFFSPSAKASQPRVDIDIYPKQPEEITETINGQTYTFAQNEDGGVEFDTILYEKPNTNQIVFPIETQGLKFYYQPPLTEEEIDEGAFRPENVVGSYAVYHESKSGDYTALGGKNYKTGKAFHIYRPKVKDALGNEIWGELNIENGTLSITIDQKFLGEAVYPVTIDPNFGYEVIGTTGSLSPLTDTIVGSVFPSPGAATADSITAYITRIGSPSIKAAIYNHAGLSPIGSTEEKTVNANTWWTFNITSGGALVAGADYVLVGWGQYQKFVKTTTWWYDAGDANQGHTQGLTYGTWPDPLVPTHDDNKYSIYATYTAAADKVITGKGEDAYEIQIDDDLNVTGYINSTAAVTTQITKAWHHLVMTYDRSKVKLYVDGVEKNSLASTAAITTNSTPLTIGSNMAGKIDEVRIYNRALSEAEVRYHYNRGGPVAQWKMDEGEGNTVYDSAHASTTANLDGHLILAGSATSSAWVSGRYGTALSLDGTDDYVDFTDVSGQARTISFWLKRGDTSDKDVIDLGTPEIKITSNAITSTGFTAPTYYVDGVKGTSLSANVWHHVVITDTADIAASDVDIGKASASYFYGLIDEVKIYNYARTPDEIRLDYNAGLSASFGPKSDCGRDPGSCMTQGLVGYWNFEEGLGITVHDSSGYSQNSTTSGASWVSGKVGSALQFDGTDDNSSLGNIGSVQTVEFWLNDSNTTDGILELIDNNTYISLSDSAISLTGFTNSTTYINGVKTSALSSGWNHVVITAGAVSAASFRIGEANDDYLQGKIDEVKLYSRALSEAEVRYHYNRGGPVAHWKMDEGSGSTVYDATDNNSDGTIPGSAQMATSTSGSSGWVAGKYSTALAFDGVDDYVTSPISVLGTGDYTIEAWFRAAGNTVYITAPTTNVVSSVELFPHIRVQYANNQIWNQRNGNGNYYIDFTADNNWHHLVWTRESGTVYGYLDGASKPVNPSGTFYDQNGYNFTDTSFFMGQFYYSSVHYFKPGSLDDVRIYNYARTAEEIRLDYNAGFAASFGPKSDCDRDPGSCMTKGLVGYWDIDEGSGTTAHDRSGNNNNGSTTNMTTPWTSGIVPGSGGKAGGSALQFDGGDDYVGIPHNAGLNLDTLTIAMWVKPTSAVASMIATKRVASNDNNEWNIYMLADGTVRFQVTDNGTGGSANTESLVTTSGIPLNQWTYMVIQKSTAVNDMKIYFNGIQQAGTWSGNGVTSIVNGTAQISIGASNGTSLYFPGLIDEFRIYNRVLSVSEIRYHYNRGGPIVWWKMDEGEGRTVYDSADASTTANFDGTLVLAGSATSSAWVQGKYGSALSLDGVDDYVSTASLYSATLAAFTYSFWIKTTSVAGGTPIDWAGYRACRINTSATNKINCLVDGGSAGSALSRTSINDGKWHHIAYTSTASTQKIYIDGIFENSASETLDTSHSGSVWIGSSVGTSSFFDGTIDDVRIYNYARTPAQIQLDYNAGLGTHFK